MPSKGGEGSRLLSNSRIFQDVLAESFCIEDGVADSRRGRFCMVFLFWRLWRRLVRSWKPICGRSRHDDDSHWQKNSTPCSRTAGPEPDSNLVMRISRASGAKSIIQFHYQSILSVTFIVHLKLTLFSVFSHLNSLLITLTIKEVNPSQLRTLQWWPVISVLQTSFLYDWGAG